MSNKKKKNGTSWKPGQSGNPSGSRDEQLVAMRRQLRRDLAAICVEHVPERITHWLLSDEKPQSMAAIQELLARTLGRAATDTGDGETDNQANEERQALIAALRKLTAD